MKTKPNRKRVRSVVGEPPTTEQCYGRQLAVAMVHRNWAECHHIIDEAEERLAEPPPRRAPLDMTLAELQLFGLTPRVISILEDRVGVMTVEQLLNCHEDQLRQVPNIGEIAILEIRRSLEDCGFVLQK